MLHHPRERTHSTHEVGWRQGETTVGQDSVTYFWKLLEKLVSVPGKEARLWS